MKLNCVFFSAEEKHMPKLNWHEQRQMASNERESPVKEKYRVCVANELKVQDGEVMNKSTASCWFFLRENNSNDVISIHFVYLFTFPRLNAVTSMLNVT